jgi:tight adherence protein C
MSAPVLSFFVQASALVPYLVVLTLAFGGVALIVYSVRGRQLPVSDRVEMLIATQLRPRDFAARLKPFLRPAHANALGRDAREIVRLYGRLGVSPLHALVAYTLTRAGFAALFAIAAFAGAQVFFGSAHGRLLPLLIALVGIILGWIVPSFIVGHLAAKRAVNIAAGLPDALELLVVCVGAGLSLEDSMDRIVEELAHSQPALADELALTAADMKILPSRDLALANLAQRVNVPSVRSVVATLSQTMRYGTPLAQALRVVATEMRNDALIEMEARANRLPTLLTLPMMLFIMPTIFLIVGGPAALRVIDALH